MLIFFSDGRLGNQVFQYAFLATLAKKNEKVLCFYMDELNRCFDINDDRFRFFNARRLVRAFLNSVVKKVILEAAVKLKIISSVQQIRNGDVSLDQISHTKGFLPIVYVKTGFFQSQTFFSATEIKISLKAESMAKAKEFLAPIPYNQRVFVHVRRGDYLNHSFSGQRGIDLPKSYYLSAMQLVESVVDNPFYVFLTDDPGFVRYCFENVTNKVISSEDMVTDLAIMSLCRSGITSNSSFSWWGAYLMSERDCVIFPRYWFGWKSRTESHIGIQPGWGKVVDVTE